MPASPEPSAHALLDERLCIVDCNHDYARLLGHDRFDLAAADIRALVHADDAPSLTRSLHRTWADGTTGEVTFRYRQPGAEPIWVTATLSRMEMRQGAVLVMTSRPVPQPPRTSLVEAHWQMAHLLLRALERGKRAFGDALVGSPATQILLLAYIAEAEAGVMSGGEIGHRVGVSWPLAQRWIDALIEAGFAESEQDGPVKPSTPIRLSPRATGLIESIFGALTTGIQQAQVPA